MFHKLDEVVAKHREITEELQLPETSANPKRLTELNKQLASMDDIVQKYLEYKKLKDEYDFLREGVKTETDNDMREMMYEEIKELEERIKLESTRGETADVEVAYQDCQNMLQKVIEQIEDTAIIGGSKERKTGFSIAKAYIVKLLKGE